jgi:hypothetical protein
MRPSRAAHAARLGCAGAGWRRLTAAASVGRGEHGKFLGQLGRTAVRAFRALPVAGADQDLAVLLTLLTMKFVKRHDGRVTNVAESSRGKVVYPRTQLGAVTLAS